MVGLDNVDQETIGPDKVEQAVTGPDKVEQIAVGPDKVEKDVKRRSVYVFNSYQYTLSC